MMRHGMRSSRPLTTSISGHQGSRLPPLAALALILILAALPHRAAAQAPASNLSPDGSVPTFFVYDQNVTDPAAYAVAAAAAAAARAAAAPPAAGAVRPRIAILDPGAKFRNHSEPYILDTMYSAESVFPRLLAASPHFTEDHALADFFYVHAWNYWSNYRNLTEQFEWLRAQPSWAKNQGRDHIIPLVHDKGRCEFLHEMGTQLDSVIVMGHWGKVTAADQANPCPMYDRHTEKCDMLFQMTKFQDMTHDGLTLLSPCYVAGQDLLIPTTGSEGPTTNRFIAPKDTYASSLTTRLLFVGGINQTHITNPKLPEMDAGYSYGVRQSAWRMFKGLPGYTIVSSIPHYWEEMHQSLFCLAPLGWGWGTRFKSAVSRGCIPVIVQDGIKVEFEDELNMFDYALRIPLLYLHRLPEFIERYIRDGRIPKFHRALSCAWRIYWWRRPEGRAFEMTMCTLKARLLHSTVNLDLNSCMLTCGDGKGMDLRAPGMNGI